jgi:hypothetical protein
VSSASGVERAGERSVAVKLSMPGEADSSATATVKDWPAFERFRRAAFYLCLCWAAAGICIFIPILHFVLVPGLLLTGPVLATLKMLETSTLEALAGDCPRCKKPGVFHVGGRFKEKRNVVCDGCGNLLELAVKA